MLYYQKKPLEVFLEILQNSQEKISCIPSGNHCVKSVHNWSFFGAYFPAFGPEKLQIRTRFMQCCSSQH